MKSSELLDRAFRLVAELDASPNAFDVVARMIALAPEECTFMHCPAPEACRTVGRCRLPSPFQHVRRLNGDF